MKKVLSFLIVLLFAGVAYAQDFSNLDETYCVEEGKYEYCLEFIQVPFGPGYQGDALLTWRESNPVTWPTQTHYLNLGGVYSLDGIVINFYDHDFKGRFVGGGIEIYQDSLFLYQK